MRHRRLLAAFLGRGAVPLLVSCVLGTRGARLRYSATVVVALLFVWSLGQWNLLGWQM